MQLVMLRKSMEQNFLDRGWTCKDLEVEVSVTLATSAPGRGGQPSVGRSTTASGEVAVSGGVSAQAADTLASLKAAIASAADQHSMAQLDSKGGGAAAELQPPETDAHPGPAELLGGAGTGNLPAHRMFATAHGPRDTAHARRAVPLLVVRVRGHTAVSVALDLISGAVCLHAGDSSLQGQVFVTVRRPPPSACGS